MLLNEGDAPTFHRTHFESNFDVKICSFNVRRYIGEWAVLDVAPVPDHSVIRCTLSDRSPRVEPGGPGLRTTRYSMQGFNWDRFQEELVRHKAEFTRAQVEAQPVI